MEQKYKDILSLILRILLSLLAGGAGGMAAMQL